MNEINETKSKFIRHAVNKNEQIKINTTNNIDVIFVSH